MSSRWRAVLGIGVSIGILLGTGILSASAQAADPRIGAWKLNVAKSKYRPGPAPQSQTLKIEPAGKGEKVTSEIVGADGKTVTAVYTANYDGKDYPITGNPNSDTVALKRIDKRTTERTDKKGGKVALVLKRVVSADGKTMTVTTKGKNAQGQTVNNTGVFEKQ